MLLFIYLVLGLWVLLSGLVVLMSVGPLNQLKKEQEAEYRRIFGNGLWLLSVGSITLYLATGDFKRNIKSQRTVDAFRPAMLLSWFQCTGFLIASVLAVAWYF